MINIFRKLLFSVAISSAIATISISSFANKDLPEENVWVTIGSDAANLINQKSSASLKLNSTDLENLSNGSVAIVNLPKHQIDTLSHFMHDNFHRCGGFIFHESYTQAQEYLANVQKITPNLLVDYTIDNPNGVSALLSSLNPSNLSSTVDSLSNFNNRYYTSKSGEDAANWIKDRWSTISNTRSDISVELFNHSRWRQPSVIATITGTTKPSEVVIIGGHLDSINRRGNPSSNRAPGADDNASGIALATEVLRAIVASGYKPERTVKFMGYAAEEVGLRGSNAIAQNFKSNNVNVVGVVQFDMSGYRGSNIDIVFISDNTNSAQNQYMTQLIDSYLPDITYGSGACGYGCSDHVAWHNQGYPASFPFESYINQSNRTIHSANDTAYNQNHAANFVKLAAVYVAEHAKGGAGSTPPPSSDPALENGTPVTGLSGSAKEQLFFTLNVPANAGNLVFNTSGGSGDADLYINFGTKPSLSTYDCKSTSSSSTESCTISNVQQGTYYIMVEAWNAISGMSLTGSYSVNK